MDVSVILVNYNTCTLTISCIESIYRVTKEVSFEIVVVDNASCDNSVAMIISRFPEVNLIQCSVNLGFGRANNLAAASAKGKYLFLLNTDTELLNNAIKIFFDFYEHDAPVDTAVIGGILLNPDLSNGWSCNNFNSIRSILLWHYSRLFDNRRQSNNIVHNISLKEKDFFYTDYVTGADMFINAELFNRTGGFDPSIFLFYEDEELQNRIRGMGYRNIIIGGTKVIHHGSGSMKKEGRKTPGQIRIISERSMFYYFRNKYGKTYVLWAKIVYFLLVALPLRFQYSFKENKEYFIDYIRF
jgi:GT2 family glycosyltransferase